METWEKQFEKLLDSSHDDVSNLIRDDVKIGLGSILTDMQKQPALYSKWAYFESRVEEKQRSAEADYKLILADVRNGIRAEGKISVAACDDRATVNPLVAQALTAYNLLQSYHTLIKQVRMGIAQKRDMLMSINSRQKVELEIEMKD